MHAELHTVGALASLGLGHKTLVTVCDTPTNKDLNCLIIHTNNITM